MPLDDHLNQYLMTPAFQTCERTLLTKPTTLPDDLAPTSTVTVTSERAPAGLVSIVHTTTSLGNTVIGYLDTAYITHGQVEATLTITRVLSPIDTDLENLENHLISVISARVTG